MKAYFFLLAILSTVTCFSQSSEDSVSAPKIVSTSTALSKITITEEYELDSTGIKMDCVVIEGKDAFEIQCMKYRGLTAEFHRPMGKTMLKRVLDATNTAIDIKTVFSGIFYLDIYNSEGIKIKTYKIDKQF